MSPARTQKTAPPQGAPLVEVNARNVYGLWKAYPVSPAAQTLAKIAGTRTLTQATLRLAIELGCVVTFTGADAPKLESVE